MKHITVCKDYAFLQFDGIELYYGWEEDYQFVVKHRGKEIERFKPKGMYSDMADGLLAGILQMQSVEFTLR